jgi:hypothetical protein
MAGVIPVRCSLAAYRQLNSGIGAAAAGGRSTGNYGVGASPGKYHPDLDQQLPLRNEYLAAENRINSTPAPANSRELDSLAAGFVATEGTVRVVRCKGRRRAGTIEVRRHGE